MNYHVRSLGYATSLALLLLPNELRAQGTFTVTFDGPPTQPPGTAYTVQSYLEAGMWFGPIPGTDGFGRVGGAITARPDNGTAYVQAALGDSLMLGLNNGSLFDLVSVDLAEYSTVVSNPRTVPFVGYYPDGTTVTASFTTDGIIDGTGPLADFQTFYFGPEMSGLYEVRIPVAGWSLDNLVFAIPEPSITGLLAFGVLLAAGFRLRKARISG